MTTKWDELTATIMNQITESHRILTLREWPSSGGQRETPFLSFSDGVTPPTEHKALAPAEHAAPRL